MPGFTGTRNFRRVEYEHSATAIAAGRPNVVPVEREADAQNTLVQAQVLRDELGVPLVIASGYRSPWVNMAVGGAAQSQHVQARAIDLWSPHASRGGLLLGVALLVQRGWSFDQLITYDHGGSVKRRMIHISWTLDGSDRKEVLHSAAPGLYEFASLPGVT